ncbi:MAG: tRNA 2-selenouridine(34) synthase MnmH [Gammaproteobacteria bacterium]
MTALIQTADFPRIFREQTPLIDVRAPVEFDRGAVPFACNLPLLTDEERAAVGKRYRDQGRDAALALGYELVDADSRQQRLQRWIEFRQDHPNALLYCYRGGLRSSISQQWLAESGVEIPRIAGGFKSLRRFLMETIESAARDTEMVIVAGKTGSGKTHFINSVENSLDLEAHANHRGSAFGKHALPQPGQVDFENRIAVDLIRLDWQNLRRLVLEDESRAIGSLSIPLAFHQRMCESPIAMIEESLANRVDTIHFDYIQSNYREFQQHFSEQADQMFAESLTDSLARIRRRLGGENFQHISALLTQALDSQFRGEGIDDHRLWIEALLKRYYDPMYDYQLEKKSHRIVFRGDRDELRNWIQHLIEQS